MRITNLTIENFRGIRLSKITFPANSRIICLIGSGDSTKSTILKAIEWILHPSWNLSVTDCDFFNCDTSLPIRLEASITELPHELLKEDKFGLYLRKTDTELLDDIDDEPVDNEDVCITIQLLIDSSLEPQWCVRCNRKDPKPISATERRLLNVVPINENYYRDMFWGKYSVLQKFANSNEIMHDAYLKILRNVVDKTEFEGLDSNSDRVKNIAQKYSVNLSPNLKNKIIFQSNSLSSSIALFDNDAPLTQRGLGSQKLISMGLNIESTSSQVILLIDEIETGLEPYRLRSLINEFRNDFYHTGQVIMTSHSSVTVSECEAKEIMVVHSDKGETSVITLGENEDISKNLQPEIRRNPEAFLSKVVIVCEGKTELGFLRALDSYIYRTKNFRISCKGVSLALGEGDTLFKCANALKDSKYKVCIVMDSDKETTKTKKTKLRDKGIPIFDWDERMSIESQIFNDIPLNLINELLAIVVEEKDLGSLKNSFKENDIPCAIENDTIKIKDINPGIREKLGNLSKKQTWFKRIDLGEKLGENIFNNIEEIENTTTLIKNINNLIDWILKND